MTQRWRHSAKTNGVMWRKRMNMERCVNTLRRVIDESGIDRMTVLHAPAVPSRKGARQKR
jgi:hypothetical protein